MKKKKPHQHSAPKSGLTSADKATRALQGLAVRDGKKVPSYAADLWRLDKETWWQSFRRDERQATKAAFDKLAARGIIIHRKTKGSPCEMLEGEDTEEGFKVTGRHQIPEQLINSPLNLKRWRQDHRLLKHLYKLYLQQTPHVRFFTLSQGPVKLADLDGAITKLHKDIGHLAHRPWIKEAGLDFVLRKTELPPQNAGQPGNEQVFLHAHIAVRCARRLSKSSWKALMERLENQPTWKHKPYDAGEIEDLKRHPDYFFKNPLASHEQDPANPTQTRRTYRPLEELTPEGTEILYQALNDKRLIYALGDFADFIRELKAQAEKKGSILKLETRFVHKQMQTRLIQVPKVEPPPGKGRGKDVKNLVIARLPGDQPGHRRLIVKGYTGATTLAGVKPSRDMYPELYTPDNSPRRGKGKIVIYPSFFKKVINYIQRLGERTFQAAEIQISMTPRQIRGRGNIRVSYDHNLINAALEGIEWLKPTGRGRGQWREWRVTPRHPNFPGWEKEARNYDPATLPGSGLSYEFANVDFNPIDAAKPGHLRTCREMRRKQAQRARQARYRLRRKEAAVGNKPSDNGNGQVPPAAPAA